MYVNAIISINNINMFILAATNNKIILPDKDRFFTISMNLELKPPQNMTYTKLS